MKIKLLKNCFVENKACKKGDIIDTKHAWLLVGSGKATKDLKAPKAKKAPVNRQVDETETR